MTPLLKFIHVLTAVSLLGTVFVSLALAGQKARSFSALKKGLVHATALAAVTGMLLVYPAHFTFHTPWIQAAMLGALLVTGLILLYFPSQTSSRPWQHRLLCLVLLLLLSVIVHDAVTKSTFLSFFAHMAAS